MIRLRQNRRHFPTDIHACTLFAHTHTHVYLHKDLCFTLPSWLLFTSHTAAQCTERCALGLKSLDQILLLLCFLIMTFWISNVMNSNSVSVFHQMPAGLQSDCCSERPVRSQVTWSLICPHEQLQHKSSKTKPLTKTRWRKAHEHILNGTYM